MNIFDTPIELITHEHILKLIGTQESDTIDFKRDSYGDGDFDKFELCKDVSAFSNAMGGIIVIGIDEENETATSIVHVPNADHEIDRIENILLSSVYERIPALKVRKVSVPVNGEVRDIVLIGIPKSIRAPHMIKRQGKTSFYKRYGRRALEMPIDEIKDAAIKSSQEIERIDSFLKERKRESVRRAGTNRYLVLFATPPYLHESNIDVQNTRVQELFNRNSAYVTQYKERDNGGWIARGDHRSIKPSLHGVIADEYRRIEIFRTGHVEAFSECDEFFIRKKKDRDQREKLVLSDLPICEFILSFIYLAQSIYQSSGLYAPFFFNLLLVNCDEVHLSSGIMSFSRFGEKILELPQQIISASDTPEASAKNIMDRFFQAFGIWESFRFKDGRLNFSIRHIDM